MRATNDRSTTSSRRARAWATAVVLVATTAVLGAACSSSTTTGSAGSTSTVAPAADALLTRLAIEGSDAAFEQRFGGSLGVGGPLVFVGRAGDQAVAYVCDGTTGTWFTGPVDAAGAGTLRTVDGDATATTSAVDGGLHVAVAGGELDGRSGTALALADGEGTLVRLQATPETGGSEAALGGVIITPDAVRGTLRSIDDGTSNTILVGQATTTTTTGDGTVRTLAPLDPNASTTTAPPTRSSTTTANKVADGQSNTIDASGNAPSSTTTTATRNSTTTANGITDGQSNTINVGEATTTTNGAPLADGGAGGTTSGTRPPGTTVIVSRTSGGLLTVSLVTSTTKTATSTTSTAAPTSTSSSTTAAPSSTPAPSTTTTASNPAASCAAQVKALQQLVAALTAIKAQLVQKARGLTGAAATAVTRQADQVQAQITELQRQIPTCR